MSIYTVRIWAGEIAINAASPRITAPAGYTLVVTDIDFFTRSSGGGSMSVYDFGLPGYVLQVQTGATGGQAHWSGRLAVPTGSSVQFQGGPIVIDVQVTGWQLLGTTPPAPIQSGPFLDNLTPLPAYGLP